jgi:hypothetical protein
MGSIGIGPLRGVSGQALAGTGEDLEVGRFVGLVIGVGLVIAALFMAVAQT